MTIDSKSILKQKKAGLGLEEIEQEQQSKLIAQNFDKPLYITNYPNYKNRLLVVEQDGIIRIIENDKSLKLLIIFCTILKCDMVSMLRCKFLKFTFGYFSFNSFNS